MSKYDEYINVPENANEILFNKLDSTMLLLIKLGIDPQEIIDHVENYIEKMNPPEIGIFGNIVEDVIKACEEKI